MKVLRWDLVGGISGDMALAALLDLGADRGAVESAIRACGLGETTLNVESVDEVGLRGMRVTMQTEAKIAQATGCTVAHVHRAWRDIRASIERTALPPRVRALSCRVFDRLAQVEGRIHGVPAEDVEFHEIGAADSIADIVGACAALEGLGIQAVEIGPFPLGHGEMRCAHGIYPLPAPAVVELLKGWAVSVVDEEAETVTPTGAALLTEWVESSPPAPRHRTIRATGIGWGHRRLRGRPNYARAVVYETIDGAVGSPAECVVLETQLDDATGESMGVLVERLRELGALDVYTTAIQMKKQRPGTLVTVLCEPWQRDLMLDAFFRHSPTLGVREYRVERTVLERRWSTAETPWGSVRVKLGIWKGEIVTRAPEMDDCIACAARHNVAPRHVYEAACRSVTTDSPIASNPGP